MPPAGSSSSAIMPAWATAAPSLLSWRHSEGRTGSSTPSRPSPGREAVLAYLSRYTHRVAISNSRLIALDEAGVTFRYKDYRRNGSERYRTMTLDPGEFIRRFLLHVLPKGFHRIRHYGLLASAGRKANIARARELLAALQPKAQCRETGKAEAAAPTDRRPPCPCCGGRMIIIDTFECGGHARAPPSTGSASGTRMP